MPLKSRAGRRRAELRGWPAFIHTLRIRTERGRTKIGQNRRPPEPSGSRPDLGHADRRRHYLGTLGRSKFKVRIVGQSGGGPAGMRRAACAVRVEGSRVSRRCEMTWPTGEKPVNFAAMLQIEVACGARTHAARRIIA